MRYSTPLLLAVIIGFFVASPMDAQRPTQRSGLWVSGEVDFGYATIECRVCNTDAAVGPVGVVQIGGSLSQKALISVELSYWRSDADTTAQEYGLAMAVLHYYPFANMPLFINAGIGVGRYAEERVSSTGSSWALSAHGFAFQVGAGYEFPLSGRFKFGPVVRYVSALAHQATLNRLGELQNMKGQWFRIGAQVTWR